MRTIHGRKGPAIGVFPDGEMVLAICSAVQLSIP
jgi:hypothetical protein